MYRNKDIIFIIENNFLDTVPKTDKKEKPRCLTIDYDEGEKN